jgi:hypothetical protein
LSDGIACDMTGSKTLDVTVCARVSGNSHLFDIVSDPVFN